VELLGRGISFAGVRDLVGPDGIVIRYTTDGRAFDRVDPVDADGDGHPDVLQATAEGLTLARGLLVGQLELPAPRLSEVVLVELGDRVDGYLLPAQGRDGRAVLVLDATPVGGIEGARHAAIRQYGFATALGLGAGVPTGWAEAFANWVSVSIAGVDPDSVELLSNRVRRLDAGLLDGAPRLAAGNALWFAFVEQAYGLAAVRLTVEELASGAPVPTALDRAVRRASRDDLASAFREFHVWSLLTGARADSKHFSFAHELEFPGFAATSTGLPALSVHREPPVASLGATQVRLAPDELQGGLRVQFEGDFSARWEVDLLLIAQSGSIHRLPLSLSPEGRGNVTVPLDGLRETLVLVRNLDGEKGAAHRYTYSAHHERAFPYEMTGLDARLVEGSTSGVLVSWETGSEQELVGFNILRRRADGTVEQQVNPVWVPALGGAAEETSYQFLDRAAEPDIDYVYRIQGITTTGLSSFSESVSVTPSP
jgi:hypothetical protein